MPNDNGTDSALWDVLKELLQEEGNRLGLDAASLASQASRRDGSLLGEAESWDDFLGRVRQLLIKRGLLDPNAAPGALIKPEKLREVASLSLQGRTTTEHELAAVALLGARASGAAAGCRPAPPARTADQVRLSLDLTLVERARAVAAARDEDERLARLLLRE